MLLPESMSRIVIVGARSRMEEAIEALYRLERAHLIDYSSDDEGFSIGAPLPNGSKASERLLKIRAMLNELSIPLRRVSADTPVPSREVRRLIDGGGVEQLDEELFAVLDERNRAIQAIADLEGTISELRPMATLPLTLDLYRGYDSLRPFVGVARQSPVDALSSLEEKELFLADDGHFLALFVRKEDEEEAQKLLSKVGFTEVKIPEGEGSPGDIIDSMEKELLTKQEELETLEKELDNLKEKHTFFIASTEEELAIEVAKAETPLRVATSEYSFVMDAWVPTADLQMSVGMLEQALQGRVSIDVAETRGRLEADEEKADPRFKIPPTKGKNNKLGEKFEYLVSLMSVPRYQETDPAFLMSLFLPMFFGIMLGDIGYALLFMWLGFYGMKNWRSDESRAVASLMFFGGIWGAIFGFFMYGEFLGMHIYADPAVHAPLVDGMAAHWGELLGLNTAFMDGLSLGVSKMHDVTFLLKLGVYIGIAHLFIGLVFGTINVKMQKGTKAAVQEKFSWVLSLLGLTGVSWGLTSVMFYNTPIEGMFLNILAVSAVLLIVGMGLNWPIAGINALLDVPGIVGNILSYTRLAAIAMSKAGMALAFNYMSITMLIVGVGGIGGILGGVFVYLIGHALVWVLALISCGLHGLRLQYVEFMSKFFLGGGDPYQPLQAKRRFTKAIETEV